MASPTDTAPPSTSTTKLVWRGATLACAACGQRGLFTRWVHLAETCPRCGLLFERIEGHWVGAVGINTIVSFGMLLVAMVGTFIAFYPELPLLPVLGIPVAVGLLAPIVLYPFSKTSWTAIDIAMRPLEPGEAPALGETA
jgi:uncharacterized protein (DUF983 family)